MSAEDLIQKATILVVDDEAAVRRVLVMRLHLAGYTVVCAEDGEQASTVHRDPRFVVLDVMLLKLDGFAIVGVSAQNPACCSSCRPWMPSLKRWRVSISVLTTICPPFSPKELEARIATILRRVGRGTAEVESREIPTGQGVLRLGELVVDTNRRQVNRGAERINLTYTEFSLLELLFREPGRVVPRAEILEQLWGYPPRRAADLRVVDVYVARLRGKLEPDPRNPELILTVRGIGYCSQRMGEAAATG